LGNFENLFKTVFIALIFPVIFTGKVNAAVLNSQTIIDQAKKDIIKQVNSVVTGQIAVEIKGIPYKSIEIPNGKIDIVTSLNLQHFSPLTIAKIDILANGEEVKSFGIPVKLTVYDQVWVAKDLINRDKSLSGSNLSLEKKI